jgi:hypothetical protein
MNYYPGFGRKASDGEVIIREARGVICKIALAIIEGKLMLTDKSLIFASEIDTEKTGIEDRIEIEQGQLDSEDSGETRDAGTDDPWDLLVPLENVISASGRRSLLRASLHLSWHDDKTEQTASADFIQKEKSDEAVVETIDLWAPVIEEKALF